MKGIYDNIALIIFLNESHKCSPFRIVLIRTFTFPTQLKQKKLHSKVSSANSRINNLSL